MTDLNMDTQFLTGDVGDEQQHVGTSLTVSQESEAAKITGMCADGMRCGPTHCPTCPNSQEAQDSSDHIAEASKMVAPYHPEPGTECLSRAVLNGQWCNWKPVVIRAYNQGEVWVQCPVTKTSFICPEASMEFKPQDDGKCYSFDEEIYHDDFNMILEEFESSKDIGEEVTYWQGEKSPYTHASFFDIEHLVEDMRERAWDEAYEDLAEAYLDDITDKHKRELTALILNYLNTHLDQPTFYGVKNIEEITGWWDGEDVTQTPMMTADEVSNLVD